MTGLTLRCLALALTALLISPLASEASQWQWPLAERQLRERFDFDRGNPYRAGARRGVTLRGQAGARVRAVCSGVVSFAGLLPDGRRGVTLRCGNLAATELGLAQIDVSRGEALVAGQQLGSLGSDALLSVGARRVGQRNGYRDPLGLLAAPPRSLPLAPLAPRGRRTPPPPRPALRSGASAENQSRPITSWLLGAAWLGLGISGAAIGGGIALRERRERNASSLAGIVKPQRQH
jgi:hypothetical protein